LAREESRGAHYRLDFPLHNDAKYLKHSVIHDDKVTFVVSALTLPLSSGT
jgi:succinate dehydrogenase/fumarate reductase flavoprotein subunit